MVIVLDDLQRLINSCLELSGRRVLRRRAGERIGEEVGLEDEEGADRIVQSRDRLVDGDDNVERLYWGSLTIRRLSSPANGEREKPSAVSLDG